MQFILTGGDSTFLQNRITSTQTGDPMKPADAADVGSAGAEIATLAPEPHLILIIEDEEGIIELVRMYLEEAGFRVLATRDGPAGLELHVRERPALVILDVLLPGMDGWEVC